MNLLDNKIIHKDMEEIYSADIPVERLKNKSVLITGSYGMLASYLTLFFCFLNDEYDYNIKIYAQGRNKEKMAMRFGDILSEDYFTPMYFDITSEIKIDIKPDFIVHAASGTYPTAYSKIPVEIAMPNALGTYYLLDYAKKVNCEGFLYFSTVDVYGKSKNGETFTEENVGSMNPLDLHSCYGESKKMGETFCHLFSYEYNVPTKMVRIAHTFSPTMDVENDPRVFASFIKNILNGEDIHMHSDGTSMRVFTYISDAVKAFLLILLCGRDGEAYNMCNESNFVSMNDIAEILISLRQDKGLKLVHDCEVKKTGYLENDLNKRNSFSSEKLRTLGWKPEVDIKTGFERVLSFLD